MGWISDFCARHAAAAAGSPVVTEAFRAAGLHQAMYVIPSLGALLVLLAALLTVARDRERLRRWMEGGFKISGAVDE